MLSLKQKFAYGLGDLGNSICYFSISFFFLYYESDILKLPAALAGLAYFIGMTWVCISNPLIGVLNDHTVSPFGRKRVYLLFGALPFAITFTLLWLAPLEASQTVKFIYATLTLLFYTTLYSLITVPYLALVPVMSRDYDERTQITGIRAILSTIGTVLGGAAAMLVSRFTNQLQGLQFMGVVFGLLAITTTLVAAQSVRGLEKVNDQSSSEPRPSLGQYWRFLKDRNVSILMIYKFLSAIATGSLMASLPYFAKYILGDEGFSTIGIFIYILLVVACIPAWNRLTHKHDKRLLLLIGMILVALFLFGIGIFVRIDSILIFYVGCGLLGMMMASYVLIPYSLPPDLVDYYQHKCGERYESVLFGMWLTSHQLGVATAGLILGTFLQIMGYDGAKISQNTQAILAIRLSLGLLPGFFMVVSAILLQRYSVSRQIYQNIQLDLSQARPPVVNTD